MENNHSENSSFWKNNVRSVPGRPSPKKDYKTGVPKPGKNQSGSFESYQNSVSDAWDLTDDEFTKEYCVLSGKCSSF